MGIEADLQKLEPGNYIELYRLEIPGEPVIRFHGHTQSEQIWWDGEAYDAWPIQAEGFALATDQPPQPKLRVANVNGSITALVLFFDDLVGATLVRVRTFRHYLDAINFPGGNPSADPTQEMPRDIWKIERKSYESEDSVEFELASALDFNGITLPRRKIINGRCGWLAIGGYRGPNCGYTGPAVATANGTPTGDMLLDRCGGLVSDCKLRFGEDGELSHGGFPAAGLLRG